MRNEVRDAIFNNLAHYTIWQNFDEQVRDLLTEAIEIGIDEAIPQDWVVSHKQEPNETKTEDFLLVEHSKLLTKYNELLMAVNNIYHNESRHDTALRYIRNAETHNEDAKASKNG